MKKPKVETAKQPDSNYTFFENVYDVVRLIPKGRVTSYGAIANYLGAGRAARMVGWAMNGSHKIKPKVPAQRVVNRNGHLTGKHHFPAVDTMEKMLKKDGVDVKEDKVVNFNQIFWDPAIELNN